MPPPLSDFQNCEQVKVCYPDVYYSDPHCIFVFNFRNAFVGLEENLRALVPAHESSKIVFGSQGAVHKFGRTMSLIEQVGPS